MTKALIAINAGSSTLKFRAFALDNLAQPLLLRGLIDRFGLPGTKLVLHDAQGERVEENLLGEADRPQAIASMMVALARHRIVPQAIVHRVVHGGQRFTRCTRLTPEVMAALEAFIPLAPLHQPVSLQVIKAFSTTAPDLLQLACFDTAFHANQPTVATRFGIARHWHDEGVRRYGFHGLSYAAINRQLADLGLAQAKVVVCHLGSGASACAMQNGQSMASSMGFSAVDGLMMSTRPGYIDPEVVLYWQERAGMSVADVRQELYKKSGLLGVSGGISADMRSLLASPQPEAQEAIALFCYRIAREVASLAAAMQGLDALVFTAGIGERSAPVREQVLNQLGWLGFALDDQANQANAQRITQGDSLRHAYRLETDEEGEMARQARALL